MRSKPRLFGLLLAGLLVGAPIVAAADVVQVTFDPTVTLIEQGSLFLVQVAVDAEATDLRGFSFGFSFDSTVIEPVSVTPGSLLLGAGCPLFLQDLTEVSAADSLWFDGASLGCSMVGPGSLVEIQFVAVAVDSIPVDTPLTWWKCILRDGSNANIDHDCADGLVTVIPGPIAVEPRSWAAIKSEFRGATIHGPNP
jgi:hypothetical protein